MQMGALVVQPGSKRDIVIERQVLALASTHVFQHVIYRDFVRTVPCIGFTTGMLYIILSRIRYCSLSELLDGMSNYPFALLIFVMKGVSL
jgi:hypothetical protein